MKKYAYLSRLEELLADLPLNERQEVLARCEEAFAEAGAEQEEETADRLGAPEEAAARILQERDLDRKEHTGRRLLVLLLLAALLLAVLALGIAALGRNRRDPVPARTGAQAAETASGWNTADDGTAARQNAGGISARFTE